MIEHLQKLQPEIVERFLEIRNAEKCGIPAPLADYILQVNEATNLFRKYQSITECSKRLQKIYPNLSISTCKSRIYDSINYFNSDCSVTSGAWNLYFADQMMKLFEVNLVAHDLREARICFQQARAYRIEASANIIDPNRLKYKQQIVSSTFELDRMGVKKNGLLKAYEKGLSIIKSRDISTEDKDRLIGELQRELNITDAEYES